MPPASAQTRLPIVVSVINSVWDADLGYDRCDGHCANRETTFPIPLKSKARKLGLCYEFETADDAARFVKAFNAECR